MSFSAVLDKHRKLSYSSRDKGDRFERLMLGFLKTYPVYSSLFQNVWLWADFPYNDQFGGRDVGIDLVAQTKDGDFWAVQCKCFDENTTISKPMVDTFLSTSGKQFVTSEGESTVFSQRLWISTSDNWGVNAEEAFRNQTPPVSRLSLSELEAAPVNWDKLDEGLFGEKAQGIKHELRPHQVEALNAVHEYFKTEDRGKLLMACGTGKTFTALRIAENETDSDGLILVLVPSIALVGQTLREWSAHAEYPIHPICICSDSGVSRSKGDVGDDSVVDLALPASTNVKNISEQIKRAMRSEEKGMTVVFSTYQSIDVISQVQRDYDFVFDLIIADEAHRTTGVTLENEDQSAFVKVHDNELVKAKKRMYMTATPRLYKDETKKKAEANGAVLCSMDDESLYGKEIFKLGFGKAVELGLLSDYKVLVLTLSDNAISPTVQHMVQSNDYSINADDASKLIGCLNALSKQIVGDEGVIQETDPSPMKRAVAFCSNINVSKEITGYFNSVPEQYTNDQSEERKSKLISVEAQHIDGGMGAIKREARLRWLKEESDGCRILTNVRCLSEGVDVPSLDAVMFLSARNSQIDVVQSVGRVMRKAPGKKYGYIIIPVVVPSDAEPEKVLDNNENFKVVWTVLNALRAHDERLGATIEKINLNKSRPSQVLIGGVEGDEIRPRGDIQSQLVLQYGDLQDAIYARMVRKVGDRQYWEMWAKKVAEIAEKHRARLARLVQNRDVIETFNAFVSSLQENINASIDEEQAIEMLSQHMITKPVFEALFENYSFASNNPVSKSMQRMIEILEENAFDKETESLNDFYESVKNTISGIDNAEGRQKVITRLYDNFFKIAFPRMVEQLGIVYTPIEVVDFMIHSVDDVLRKEFGRSFTDEGVNILDPFTGTGTFVTRLLESGLIKPEDLERKYSKEIFANEIVLLAYYIAAVNIENAYHSQMPEGTEYKAFNGICLTDTFQLNEFNADEHLASEFFPRNNERVNAQKNAPITVIMSNPPYSAGQKSADDNAQNLKYPKLDKRIEETYSVDSNATLKNTLYDSYIRAYRWATDRLSKNGGIVCFVTNGGWLDGNSTDGFRKHLEKDFSSVYVFNLRGDARTSGERRQKEKGNVFGQDTQTPITITLLVKNPASENENATIYYHDIGDYLSREDKLSIIKNFGTVQHPEMKWTVLHPNDAGDWINARNPLFMKLYALAPESKNDSCSIFNQDVLGVSSSRDAWVYNLSEERLLKNMMLTSEFYNSEVKRYIDLSKKGKKVIFKDIQKIDTKKISWSDGLTNNVSRNTLATFQEEGVVNSLYRPFFKQHLYSDRLFLERPGKAFNIINIGNSLGEENLIICMMAKGSKKDFSTLITDIIPDNHLVGDTCCLPMYYYEEVNGKKSKKGRVASQSSLFDTIDEDMPQYVRKDGISDFILKKAHEQYQTDEITKEDIFFYVYGILHSKEYRETFSADLKKVLARIPLVESKDDFYAFSKAGRLLADLHLNYETVEPCPGVEVIGAEFENFKVQKMKFAKKDKKDDKTRIIFNNSITVDNIPEKAYEYVVNGKSAVEWLMERYAVTTDDKSGIVNDPNDWADEVGNERYILDLLLSVINVSVQTVDIVNSLPKLKFEAKK